MRSTLFRYTRSIFYDDYISQKTRIQYDDWTTKWREKKGFLFFFSSNQRNQIRFFHLLFVLLNKQNHLMLIFTEQLCVRELLKRKLFFRFLVGFRTCMFSLASSEKSLNVAEFSTIARRVVSDKFSFQKFFCRRMKLDSYRI